jgi:hypothetical protein
MRGVSWLGEQLLDCHKEMFPIKQVGQKQVAKMRDMHSAQCAVHSAQCAVRSAQSTSFIEAVNQIVHIHCNSLLEVCSAAVSEWVSEVNKIVRISVLWFVTPCRLV